jgi:hypothetical protein
MELGEREAKNDSKIKKLWIILQEPRRRQA